MGTNSNLEVVTSTLNTSDPIFGTIKKIWQLFKHSYNQKKNNKKLSFYLNFVNKSKVIKNTKLDNKKAWHYSENLQKQSKKTDCL